MQSPALSARQPDAQAGHTPCTFCPAMLIGRCAWHMLYYGHPRWEGVASWQGWNVRFTDGICPRCLERFREEHQAALARRSSQQRTLAAPALTPEEAA